MIKNFTLQNSVASLLAFLAIAMICHHAAHAQVTRVSGRITDESGSPMPGVNVVVKGTTTGTASDGNGAYTVNLDASTQTLIFSFIGHATQEIEVNGRTSIDVVMAADTRTLSEVVVVGYGSQMQREVTGSVQQVKAAELKDLPVAQITQKLQGRLAGVQINQTTGKPGQGMQVRIRGQVSLSTVGGGSSDPLYVVDGFPIVGDISTINPDEIENISVLKDAASASLYGSRAANGVVLITTKKGQRGQTNIDFSAYYGIQEVPQKGRPKVMNGAEFAQFKKESYEDLGQEVPEAFQNPAQYGEGYDWYGGMLRTAPIQNYSLSVSTSRDKFSTSAILGYFNQDGVMYKSNFTRYSLRINTEFKATDRITIGLNVAPLYSVENTPTSDGAFYATNQSAVIPGGLLYNALLTWPILPYKNPDGSLPLTAYIPGISAFPAPNWYRALNEVVNETKTVRFISNAYIDFEILEGLNVKSSINTDVGFVPFFNFQPSTTALAFTALPPTQATSYRRTQVYTSWLNENLVTYKRSTGDHNFEILAGFTTQKYRMDSEQTRATNFPDDRIQTIQSAVDIDRTQTLSDNQEWSLMSLLSRVNYNYKGKYLLALAIRRDGSSRFGADNKWGNFPSISAGWVISNESFMRESGPVSFLKLRASYGVIGNNNIGNYTQYATVTPTTNAIFGSTVASGASVTSLSNDDLGWETTKQIDVGLDVGLLNDRVNVGYDYYNKQTTNLLYSVAVPQESGFTTFTGNIGELKFWGHEFTVSSKNLVGNLQWSTDFNIAFNDNKVVALSDGVDRIYGGQGLYQTLTQVGERIGQFWGLIQEGVYVDQADFDGSPKAQSSQVGTIKYRDVNRDGVITYGGDDDDRTYIGNPFPRVVYGITNNFSYKNLDLSIVVSGTAGNDLLVMTDQGATNLDGVFNVLKDVKNRWRSESNPGNGRYGKTTAATFMERDWESTRFVSDGSHLTIRNVTLGYNLPVKDRKIFRTIRVYGSVQQLYRFTKYRGPNPEATAQQNGTPGTTLNLGFDWATYPIPRTYTVGLNIGI
jgi:TonB-linked SusC/RagA family outer membrane protein